MSLINEALKRTEADKRERSRRQNASPALTPLHEDPSGKRPGRRLGQDVRSILLLVAVLAVGVLCVLWAVDPGASLLLSRVPTAGAAETRDTPTESIPEPDDALVEMAATSRWAASEAEIALRKTLEAVSRYRPAQPAGAKPAPAPPPNIPTGNPRLPVPADTRAEGSPGGAAASCPTERTERPKATPPPLPAPPSAKAAPRPGRLAAPSKPQQPQPRYRLTGIVAGRREPVAIINGFFVREGQTVDNARVLRIGRHTVVLEVDGVRVTIKM